MRFRGLTPDQEARIAHELRCKNTIMSYHENNIIRCKRMTHDDDEHWGLDPVTGDKREWEWSVKR